MRQRFVRQNVRKICQTKCQKDMPDKDMSDKMSESMLEDFFFGAHAVHAPGPDGHQNVLSLVSYSHMLENR